MTKATDFKVGDHVLHSNGEPGIVEEIKPDGAVRVMFPHASAAGTAWYGEYDHDWFRIHPNSLRHS